MNKADYFAARALIRANGWSVWRMLHPVHATVLRRLEKAPPDRLAYRETVKRIADKYGDPYKPRDIIMIWP